MTPPSASHGRVLGDISGAIVCLLTRAGKAAKGADVRGDDVPSSLDDFLAPPWTAERSPCSQMLLLRVFVLHATTPSFGDREERGRGGTVPFTLGVHAAGAVIRECTRMKAAVSRVVRAKEETARRGMQEDDVPAAAGTEVFVALKAWLIAKRSIVSYLARQSRTHGSDDADMLRLEIHLVRELSLMRRVLRAYPELDGQNDLEYQRRAIEHAASLRYGAWEQAIKLAENEWDIWSYVHSLTKWGMAICDRGERGEESSVVGDRLWNPAEAEENATWDKLAEICSRRLHMALIHLNCAHAPAFTWAASLSLPPPILHSPEKQRHVDAYMLHSLASELKEDAAADDRSVLQAKLVMTRQNAPSVLRKLRGPPSAEEAEQTEKLGFDFISLL